MPGDPGDWTLLPALETYPDFARRWDELNARMYHGHPLLDSRFVGPLLRHFGAAHTRLAILGNPDRTEAMMIVEPHRLGTWRTFLPSQAPIAPVLMHAEHLIAAGALMHSLQGHTSALDFLCQDPEYSAFHSERAVGPRCAITEHAPTMAVNLEGQFERYWQSRSRTLQKNMRRYASRAARDGMSIEMRIYAGAEECADAVRAYGVLESSGWKGRAGTAVHTDNAQGSFYSEVMRGFGASADARAYALFIGDELASMRLTISSDQMLVILKSAYSERFKEYAPGRLLLERMLAQLFTENRFAKVEFYTNARSHQLAWATDSRMISHFTVYATSVERMIARTIREVRHRLRRRFG